MTKIEWAEDVWNVKTGCTPISEGCAKCYAKRMATRLRGRYGYPADDPFRVTFHPDRLEQPLKWKKPRRIFVCSMGDLFHSDVKLEWVDKIIQTIALCKQHKFMFLTKRPAVMLSYFEHLAMMLQIVGESRLPIPNLYLGVTAENQRTADERIPILLQIPAAVRFVSVEPYLSGINIEQYLRCQGCGYTEMDKRIQGDHRLCTYQTPVIDWVICGAETGPGARPMELEWARDLRDQCKEANVPYFFKKAGPKGTPTPEDLMIREFPTGVLQ